MRSVIIPICLAFLFLTFPADPAGATAGRALKVVTLRSGRPGVQGAGWGQKRVTVSLQTGHWLVAASVRPNARGSFRLAAAGLNLCAGALFRAYDVHGHMTEARGPALKCAVPRDLPPPTLRVVVGHTVMPPTVEILAGHPASVTLHLGDVLYLWESGTTVPAWSPRVSDDPNSQGGSALLPLIEQGQTAARMCPQVDCAAGFYWKWVAAGLGDTGIELSAACRRSTPACMVPDFIIRVHIVA